MTNRNFHPVSRKWQAFDRVGRLAGGRGPSRPFGIDRIDDRLVAHGIGHALHGIAAARLALRDDAAATLFVAGSAAFRQGRPNRDDAQRSRRAAFLTS
jgi:hypothetical protein